MSKEYTFSPSLMCMDYEKFKESLLFFDKKASSLHVDIMDGHFVPNITLSLDYVKAVKKVVTNVPVEAHFMVTNPEDYVQKASDAGVDCFSFHAEAVFNNSNAFRVIDQIKSCGMRCGVAINPSTPLNFIELYLHLLDKVIFMTVDPGFAGQRFITEVGSKVIDCVAKISQMEKSPILQIDGSCNRKNFPELRSWGATDFVVGTSGLFSKSENLAEAWEIMLEDFYSSLSI